MPKQKRGARAAVARELLIPLLAIAVIGLVIFAIYYLNGPRPLTEEQKAALREKCARAYQDPQYELSSVTACDTMGAGARQTCIAWTTGNQTPCQDLRGAHRQLCIAQATKNPLDCDAIDTTSDKRDQAAVQYCKAYVTRDGSLCAAITDESRRLWCEVTINENLDVVLSRTAEFCGARLLPAEQ